MGESTDKWRAETGRGPGGSKRRKTYPDNLSGLNIVQREQVEYSVKQSGLSISVVREQLELPGIEELPYVLHCRKQQILALVSEAELTMQQYARISEIITGDPDA